jgi:hypothetical protein
MSLLGMTCSGLVVPHTILIPKYTVVAALFQTIVMNFVDNVGTLSAG